MSKGGIKIDTNQQLEYLLNYLIDERQENIEIPEDIIQKKNLLRSLMNVRPPIPISEEFLDVQDEYLTNEISILNELRHPNIVERFGWC